MADTRRMKALRGLAASMPGQNQQIAQGLQASRDIQMQQAVRAAPPAGAPGAVPAPVAAAAIGTQQAQAAGASQMQQAQAAQQQAGQLQGLQFGEAQMAERERQGAAQRGLSAERQRAQDTLSSLSENIRNDLHESRLQFRRDEAGRNFYNERQLADFKMTQARSKEEFANWAQQSQNAHRKKITMMEIAHKKLQAALDRGYLTEKQKLDQASKRKIAKALAEHKKAIEQAKAEAANKNAMWSAGGAIIGGVVGGVYGGPGGAAAGASLGAGAGSFVGSQSGNLGIG